MKRFPAVEIELLDKTKKLEPVRRAVKLIFTNSHDKPIRRAQFADVWRPAARRVGLADGDTFHDLRHYYASLLIQHNESVKVVQ